MAWLGGVLNLVGGRRDNMFNKEEADRARDWSKDMSNTEVQRRVQDMIKAGINPMLAVSSMGGASTPGAASASSSGGGDFGSGMAAWAAAQLAKENVKKAQAETRYIDANSAKVVEETKQLAEFTPYSGKKAFMESEKLFSDMQRAIHDQNIAEAEAALRNRNYVELQPLVVEYQRLMNKAAELGMSEKEADAKFFQQVDEGGRWLRLIKELLIGIRNVR